MTGDCSRWRRSGRHLELSTRHSWRPHREESRCCWRECSRRCRCRRCCFQCRWRSESHRRSFDCRHWRRGRSWSDRSGRCWDPSKRRSWSLSTELCRHSRPDCSRSCRCRRHYLWCRRRSWRWCKWGDCRHWRRVRSQRYRSDRRWRQSRWHSWRWRK